MSVAAHQDFIGVYPGLLSAERCSALIEQFDRSQMAVPGCVGGGVMPDPTRSANIQIAAKITAGMIQDISVVSHPSPCAPA